MKSKTALKIITDMGKAGIVSTEASLLSKASGLSGEVAKQFIIDNDLLDYKITPLTQKNIFSISYLDNAQYIKKICIKASKEENYKGDCNWDKLDNRIREIVIDLGFRGDYTYGSRKYIQDSIINNDLVAVRNALANKSYWPSVPKDRFERRVKYLNQVGASK